MFDELLVCLKEDQMSEKLGKMILLFSTNLVKHRNFIRYGHMRDDLIGTAVLGCMKSWNKFRPMRNNVLERDEEGKVAKSERVEWDGKISTYDYNIHNSPFNFFTTCARNELLQHLKSYHYKQKNLVNELLIEIGESADYGYDEMMREKQERERTDVYNESEDDESLDDLEKIAKEIKKVKEDFDSEVDFVDDEDYDGFDFDEDDLETEKSFEEKSPFKW